MLVWAVAVRGRLPCSPRLPRKPNISPSLRRPLIGLVSFQSVRSSSQPASQFSQRANRAVESSSRPHHHHRQQSSRPSHLIHHCSPACHRRTPPHRSLSSAHPSSPLNHNNCHHHHRCKPLSASPHLTTSTIINQLRRTAVVAAALLPRKTTPRNATLQKKPRRASRPVPVKARCALPASLFYLLLTCSRCSCGPSGSCHHPTPFPLFLSLTRVQAALLHRLASTNPQRSG